MMMTLRVRPGFTHGASKQYQGGDTFTVPEDAAALLLAAFGDKLEDVSSVTFQVSSEAAVVLPPAVPVTGKPVTHVPGSEGVAGDGLPANEPGFAVDTETPKPAPTKRARKSGGL